MPFRLVTGTMGGGKSYYGAELCLKYWNEGATVHTNIDLVMEEVTARGFADFTVLLGEEPEEWEKHLLGGVEGQENLVIIDEAMMKFEAHDWQTTRKKHKQLMQFLTQSRKAGLDIYMIGQAQKGMDAQFSRIALQIVNCTAVKEWPVIGAFLVTLRGDFCRKRKFPNGTSAAPAQFVRFDSKVGSIYRTESMDARFDGLERRVTRRPRNEAKSRLKSWAFLIAFVATILVVFWLIKQGFWRLFGKHHQEPTTTQAAVPEPSRTVNRVTTPPLAGASPGGGDGPAPEVARPKLKVWGVADWGVIRFWEASTGVLIAAGAVYDDAVIKSVDMGQRIFSVRLDDGRTVRFRPAVKADYVPKPQTIAKPWNQPLWPLSSASSSPASP